MTAPADRQVSAPPPYRPRAAMSMLAVACALMLGGCESFDLTDIFPDGKKKLAGERRPVFPEGVPGVPQGVPAELVKGYQPPDALASPVAEPEPVVEEKPKPAPQTRRTAARPKPQPAPQQAAPQNQEPAQQPAQNPQWPSQPTQQQSAWPAPPATGTFSR